IGGNSMYEHFIAASSSAAYIDNVDGPESCNTNNMLKLTEILSDGTHDAKYADFYEYATWNHILSTQDPTTGGYVYFTTLRPQGYRIYSTVNQSMWCCVGTGMENHSKYGHFIYTHDGNTKLYVNLFTASQLTSDDFVLTQETQFPYESQTRLTVGKSGTYTIAIRHPWWTTADYQIDVNGETQSISVTKGTASYVELNRTWQAGDVITVSLPMELRYTQCPNYYDYIAFQYGPILLAAQTTSKSQAEFEETGIPYEALQNEYGHEGRMDHAPGSRGRTLGLSSAPLLIGARSQVLSRITPTAESLRFKLAVNRGKWTTLSLVPFYTIQHARYSCYFYQQTETEFEKSDMAWDDQQQALLEGRTIDFVGTGEQQSEAGHQFRSSADSNRGSYNNEFYRDAQSGGWFEYVLETNGQTDNVSLMLRFTTADHGRVGTAYIDGVELAQITIPSSVQMAESNGFYNDEYPIPAELLKNSDGTPKTEITFRFEATGTTPIPGLYYLRLLTGYNADHYRFIATDWTTGDANRVPANKVVPNKLRNTIRVTASGQNNVCLKMETAKRIYMVNEDEKFFIIKGIGLSTADGDSYLWWLNGKNRGTSVKPTYTGTADDGATIIAWDITQSGINDNCYGRRWNFAYGQTIFGLTCKNSACTIQEIGFYTSVEDFLVATHIPGTPADRQQPAANGVYDLQGRLVAMQPTPALHGIYVVDGKKVIVK
ncbi:MAG: glycoside hydrolase family 127 protein, partial [Bacteroidaceae bacterium]|nr:glycoside hydrolase family 127 protein [Bacteroidaceae bacterium]